MIAIVDYGVGNLRSVLHAFEMVGADAALVKHPEELAAAERIVLPGVGAFGECVGRLRASGFVEALEEEVRSKGKPLLGICVGLQLLAREGHEMGIHQGLNWIPGTVERFNVPRPLKVPHVGWNDVIPEGATSMFKGIGKDRSFYFVHSYHLVPDDPAHIAARCEHGETFTAAILRDNVFATQFHPEKSQQNGLKILENFIAWTP